MRKHICLVATASHASGAYSIYKQVIATIEAFVAGRAMTDLSARDYEFYIFVDPRMEQRPLPQVRYIALNTAGFRRVRFDFHGFAATMRALGVRPDAILSFHNMGVRYEGSVPQIIYFQNLLPLVRNQWNPLRKADRPYFFYAALYPHYIRRLLPSDATVVVQADFIKEMFALRFSHERSRIVVQRPAVSLPAPESVAPAPLSPAETHLLYPAQAYSYKHHAFLLDALRALHTTAPEAARRLRFHFTLRAADLPALARSAAEAGFADAFVWHGLLAPERLQSLYAAASAVVFPSTIETLGFPLLEGAAFGLPVLASDQPYAREALGDYAGAQFLPPLDAQAWASALLRLTTSAHRYAPPPATPSSAWQSLLRLTLTAAERKG